MLAVCCYKFLNPFDLIKYTWIEWNVLQSLVKLVPLTLFTKAHRRTP